MSVLLDILAYNTYYNGFYLNIAANESFLDTAQIRQNLLSHAKMINYVPTSKRGAMTTVDIIATPTSTENQSTNEITLDKFTTLVGSDIDGINYPFITMFSNTVSKINGSFHFSNVNIKQGEIITYQFPYSSNNTSRRFEIPSSNIDTSTLIVTVTESSSNNATSEYKLANDITEVTTTSKIYYLEENENLNYTITFGDGVLGKRLSNGNIITVTFVDTLGALAKNIVKFAPTAPVGGLFRGNVSFTNISTPYSGSDKETEDVIRFRAPIAYTAQNRAVTKSDYESIIIKDFPTIESVKVWGGEENDPIVYGKMFISAKTKGFFALSNLEKENIKNSLIQNRNVMTVIPEFVDADYCFLLVSGKVTYNPVLTSKTSNQLLEVVKTAIRNYNRTELNQFNSIFRKSKLQYYIENSDPAITGSDITVYLQKRQDITNLIGKTYTINFGAPLKKGDLRDRIYSYPQIVVKDVTGVQREVLIEEVYESLTGISDIVILDGGSNYSVPPTVNVYGDGTGAKAVSYIVNGRVSKIEITNKGYNYTRATVEIVGDGVGARGTVEVQNNIGDLRTYYYKENGEKVIVNDKIGTVDYVNGKIILNSLYTLSVAENDLYDTDVLTLNAVAADEIITPLRNRIIVLDENNPLSTQIEMTVG